MNLESQTKLQRQLWLQHLSSATLGASEQQFPHQHNEPNHLSPESLWGSNGIKYFQGLFILGMLLMRTNSVVISEWSQGTLNTPPGNSFGEGEPGQTGYPEGAQITEETSLSPSSWRDFQVLCSPTPTRTEPKPDASLELRRSPAPKQKADSNPAVAQILPPKWRFCCSATGNGKTEHKTEAERGSRHISLPFLSRNAVVTAIMVVGRQLSSAQGPLHCLFSSNKLKDKGGGRAS